jgi:hypothetical protein
MVVRVLPYFLALCGSLSAAVNEVGLDQFLSTALRTVNVPFALNNLSVAAINAEIDLLGRCSNITLDAIDAKTTNFTLGLNVSGLGLGCDIDAHLRFAKPPIPLFPTDFWLNITFLLENGWVNFPITVPPVALDEEDPNLLLPARVAVDVDTCTGKLPGYNKIDMNVPAAIKNLVVGSLETILTDPQTFCAIVNDVLKAVGNTSLTKLDEEIVADVKNATNDKGLNETTYEDPNHEIAHIADNIGTTYLKNLMDVLGDPTNPQGINKVLERNHGASIFLNVDHDPTASVPCPKDQGKMCPLFPLSLLDLSVSTWTVGLDLIGLEVTGLDTVSKLAFQTPSQNMVNFALGYGDLGVKVNFTMRVHNEGAPDALVETFSLALGLKDFEVGLTGFWHFNGTTADKFSFLQLPHPGCLSQTVNSTQAGLTHASLSLPDIELAVLPAGQRQPDNMERGLDNTVYALTQLIFHQYADSINEEANWALSIYARDLINKKLDHYLALPVTDKDEPKPHNETRVCLPAKPAYQSAFLHNYGFWGSVTATAIGLVLLVAAAFSKKGQTNKVKDAPPPAPDTPAAPLTAGAQDPPLDDADEQGDHLSLARNQKLPIGLRAGIPLLVFANAILFISSNAGSGASIYVDLSAGGQNLFPSLPPAFDFSLVNTIVEMAQGKVWLLVFVIGFFSGVWPYVKLGMMLCCWFIPANKLSVPRRHKLLEFLDAFGKWSLVDTYVLVLFVVAFSINMECSTAVSPTFAAVCEAAGVGNALFKLYVLPTMGFHTFLIATLMSLVNGLAMSTCHRYVHRIGEFGPAEDYESIEGLGNKRRLCAVLKDSSQYSAIGVTIGLLVSMVLAVVGVFMTTFEFVFQGIAGLALGPDESVRAYSLFGLGEELPAASINPNTFGIHWIQFFFIVFSGVTVLIFLGLLLVLWNVPLTVKGQRTFLVLAQIMNAWSGLDVFVVAILACVLEISQFANFILGDTGLDAINPYMPLIFSFFPEWSQMLQENGGATIFTLTTQLKPGFWLLAVAAVLSTGIGQVTLNKCSRSLFDANNQPLTNSIAASFTNTGTSVAGP